MDDQKEFSGTVLRTTARLWDDDLLAGGGDDMVIAHGSHPYPLRTRP